MTFDEKRDQVILAENIGRMLDGEVSAEERADLLFQIRQTKEGAELLQRMSEDNVLLQNAVPAAVPEDSMDRFHSVMDREFATRGTPPHPRHARLSWTGTVVQMAAALVLIAGTFAFTTFWMQSRMDDAVASLAAHMETERVLIARTVQEALETKVSGEPVHIGPEGDWSEILTPIRTYKSKSGHWCRQYLRQTTFGGLDLAIKGTACRDENGAWTTVFAEPVSDKFSPQSAGI